jgi:hypothetical protein
MWPRGRGNRRTRDDDQRTFARTDVQEAETEKRESGMSSSLRRHRSLWKLVTGLGRGQICIVHPTCATGASLQPVIVIRGQIADSWASCPYGLCDGFSNRSHADR